MFRFNRHRIEFVRNSGDLYFYERGGGKPFVHLEKAQIDGFTISQEWYRSSRGKPLTQNFVLSVLCCDGRLIGLCRTTDEALLQELVAEMEQIVRRD